MQETDSEIKRERDRRDLAEELNGGNAGQVQRFLPEHLSPQALEKKRQEEYDNLALLAALKAAKPYEVLFQETMDILVQYEKLTEQAMTERDNILTEQQEILRQRLLTAGRLSDGTMVFKDKHGDVRRADETLVEDQAEIDGIIWHDDAITFEEFQERNQAIADTEQEIDEIRRYQTDVLGAAREELTSDKKPTYERLYELQDELIVNTPDFIVKELESNNSQNNRNYKNVSTFDIATPNFQG